MASTRSGSGSSTRASAEAPVAVGQASLPPRLHPQPREDRVAARQARHLQPPRLPPGPLQRALPGRGLAGLADARRRHAGRAPGGLSRQLPGQPGAEPRPSTTSGPTRPSRASGLQSLYAKAWRRVAAKFRPPPTCSATTCSTSPGRATPFDADDCLNTAGCRSFDTTTLAPFDERMIAAIRGVDPETLIFYEPLVTFDFGADSQLPDTGDRRPGSRSTSTACPARSADPAPGPRASRSRSWPWRTPTSRPTRQATSCS